MQKGNNHLDQHRTSITVSSTDRHLGLQTGFMRKGHKYVLK